MPSRKPKEEPELLIVSFCDIVTITTAAMFFAMLITVQQAVKIPIYSPPPMAHIVKAKDGTEKQPVFFECRTDQVFYVDKAGLDEKVAQMLSALTPGMRSGDPTGFVKAISGNEVGNEYYKVVPSYLLAMIMALEPRPGSVVTIKTHCRTPMALFKNTCGSSAPIPRIWFFWSGTTVTTASGKPGKLRTSRGLMWAGKCSSGTSLSSLAPVGKWSRRASPGTLGCCCR